MSTRPGQKKIVAIEEEAAGAEASAVVVVEAAVTGAVTAEAAMVEVEAEEIENPAGN